MKLITKAIITAMKEEADHIIKRFNLKEVKTLKNIKIYEWTKKNSWEQIVLVISWIWKVQSTIATTYLFENYLIEKLINVWIAWNLWNMDVKVWDVFIPNTFIQHDIYIPFDWEHLNYAKDPIFLEYAIDKNYDLRKFWLIMNWICLTWDQFIDDKEKVKELRELYWADIVDMEAFCVLSVARENNALDKCVVIKAVSDWADNEAIEAHMNNLDFAMQNSIDILELVI